MKAMKIKRFIAIVFVLVFAMLVLPVYETTAEEGDAAEAWQAAPSAAHDDRSGGTEGQPGARLAGSTDDEPLFIYSDWVSLEDLTTRDEETVPLVYEGGDYTVRLFPDKPFPKDAVLSAPEIENNGLYQTRAAAQLGIEEHDIAFLRVFDLTILSEGQAVEPEGPVRVEMDIAASGEHITALHFPKSATGQIAPGRRLMKSAAPQEQVEILETEVSGQTIQFTTGSFSAFAIVGYTIETRIQASDGNTYVITVSYGSDAGIPEDAKLDVTEIVQDGDGERAAPTAYAQYVEDTERALGLEAGAVRYARFFDIHIVDGEGRVIQPAEGTSVHVSVRLEDMEAETEPKVVHFGEQTEILRAQVDQNTVSFDATGFSVYAIVDAPEPETAEINAVTSLDELTDGVGFYLSYGGTQGTGNYISSNLNSNGCFVEVNSFSTAAVWYFEADGGNFRIYTYVNGEKKYLSNPSGNSVSLTDDSGALLVISPSPEEKKFYFKSASANRWLQHSNSGGGIRFYTDNKNAANSRLTITYASSYVLDNDPYGLDGAAFGIAYNDNSATAVGLTAQGKIVSNTERLLGQDMLIRPDVLDHDGLLLVAQNADIPFWTFHNDHEDQYTISTAVDGQEMYLVISGGNVTLTAEPSEASLIKAVPGTGSNSGKWHFTVDGYSLNFSGSVSNGFNAATGTGATTWMNLVERSVLTDEDFQKYSAKKVSISDHANVYDGQQVVIYTRSWNDTTKQYEFYAVDHDGTLVRCYDNGDGIEWIGSRVNTALWEFTEYFDGGRPNYFYELKNVQYGQYIAPQAAGGQVLSGSAIGINLNGRRYGENYSTIIAWDDASYAYAGLKTENGHVVSCPLSEAEDFYFAVVNPIDPSDTLTTVSTIDNNAYGITMKMIDFNNPSMSTGDGSRDSVQHAFFGAHANGYEQGLLSTNLTGDYPTTTSKTGHEVSLGNLFSGMTPVNHLFLQSIHNESGYFEYSSTQNFAHLNEDGNFTVYDQIGQVGASSSGNQGDFGPTRTHGQFMPYNDLVEGRYSTATNQTDVLAQELPDVEPRKGEKLYLIPRNEADYFFGMELSASFTQTPSGLDAWGHDIIFEFSGDDDFWLYVDGELVIDLGGVRPALTGSVNFRTGVVKNAGTTTSLYEVFRKNYQARGLSTEEIAARLDDIFTQNEDGQYIFKDYTNHDMRIFYMERGAGGSNLHMRFNLAAVRPGTFILSKKLSGTDEADNALIEFPYQIYYKSTTDGELGWHQLEDTVGNSTASVVYEGTNRPVTYRSSYMPAGGTAAYAHVFLLKPGESAEVTLPEDATVYKVVECGVNPDIYDVVKANSAVLTGTETANLVNGTPRQDFATDADTLENRTEVEFDNHVREGAMRTLELVKKLYDVDGTTLLHYPDNDTLFSFRLYLGGENADGDNLPLASLYSYFVKDPDGYYCRWDTAQQRFVSLGKREYSALTDAEKESATFTTSMYGSISKIPADHTVEVRSLILGTQYKVEERNYEVPRGYTLRSEDGYTRVDGGRDDQNGMTPYAGSILRNENPRIEVRNQKGWGLTVEKVWTDSDFMESHDDVYVAVYIQSGDSLILYPGSVRRLKDPDTELYFFFEDLKYGDWAYAFSDFVIREVALSGSISVDEDGTVTGYDSITPLAEGGTISVGGVPAGKEHQSFNYTVQYEVGESTGRNENIRTDTVTNSRPGIVLYKTDLDEGNLSGAVFTLTDENGENVALPAYSSGADGLITIAYLAPGVYTLTEVSAPKGYVVLDQPLTLTLDSGYRITVTPGSDQYAVTPDPSGAHIAVLTIRDRTTGLVVKKKNALTGQPLADVHFALYHQVTQTDGTVRKDYRPIPGYDDLVTDENGIVPQVTEALQAGTYYLSETQAAAGFILPEDDLCFTIGTDGTVSLNNHENWLVREVISGSVSYTITIPNGEEPEPVEVEVSGVKVLTGRDMEAGEFTFSLYQIDAAGAIVEGGAWRKASNPAGAAGEQKTFTFDPLVYTLSDFNDAAYHDASGRAVFYYIVEEDVPEGGVKNAVVYSTARFLVVVRLAYVDDSLLAVKEYYQYDDAIPSNLMPVEMMPDSIRMNA